MTEPIPDFATPRKCGICQEPANCWHFRPNKLGGIDRSTREPRCSKHKEQQKWRIQAASLLRYL